MLTTIASVVIAVWLGLCAVAIPVLAILHAWDSTQ